MRLYERGDVVQHLRADVLFHLVLFVRFQDVVIDALDKEVIEILVQTVSPEPVLFLLILFFAAYSIRFSEHSCYTCQAISR